MFSTRLDTMLICVRVRLFLLHCTPDAKTKRDVFCTKVLSRKSHCVVFVQSNVTGVQNDSTSAFTERSGQDEWDSHDAQKHEEVKHVPDHWELYLCWRRAGKQRTATQTQLEKLKTARMIEQNMYFATTEENSARPCKSVGYLKEGFWLFDFDSKHGKLQPQRAGCRTTGRKIHLPLQSKMALLNGKF